MSKEIRPRLRGNKKKAFQNLARKDVKRILVIGDLHAPFDLDQYFDHCVETYAKYNCNQVVFIGDVIDNHFSSYHETDANGMGGAQELDLAIDRLRRWYKQFPVADVTIGNHDRLIMRKAQSSAVPSKWIKQYKEVLETPNWNFTERVVYDNVQYIHGEAGTARTKSQCYTEWAVGRNFKVFGCQVGCGINFDTYAMAYAKAGKKPAIGCVVVIDGNTCINELMDL